MFSPEDKQTGSSLNSLVDFRLSMTHLPVP